MRLIRFQPAAPLEDYIECFWWSSREQPQTECESMLPSGKCQLVFALHEHPMTCLGGRDNDPPLVWSRGIVHGPQGSYFVSGPKTAGAVVGVSFRLGAAGAALGVPVADLVDRHVPIEDLWGVHGRLLHERLLAADSPAAAFWVLERFFLQRLTRPLLIHPAIARALGPCATGWAHRRIAELQRDAGFSPRHYIALFRGAVGLNPKHFYRLQRLSSALESLAALRPAPLANIAAAAGYSDQSHLTREFRDFTGVTPSRYRPRDRRASSTTATRGAGLESRAR